MTGCEKPARRLVDADGPWGRDLARLLLDADLEDSVFHLGGGLAAHAAGHVDSAAERPQRRLARVQPKILILVDRSLSADRQQLALRHDLDLVAGNARQVYADADLRVALPDGHRGSPGSEREGPDVSTQVSQQGEQPVQLLLD